MTNFMNGKRMRLLMIVCLLLSQQALAAALLLSGGKVSDGDGKQISMRLNAIDLFKEYPEGIFLAGHEVDAEANGNKVPTVVMLNGQLETMGHWTFKLPIREIFRFRDEIYLFDFAGHVYRFENHQWAIDARWRFDPWSVIYPLPGDLVVCHPAPITKAESGTRTGGCRSLAREWAVPLYWTKPKPQICGQQLRVVVWIKGRQVLQTLRLSDGSIRQTSVLSSKAAAAKNLDLCQFDQ